ncbi:stigma-specific STIG1-like protein 3 [Phragmites australis]|uniref:stigma-specific STIG1-like protein 3 n=1 Tax=Phragmites australis TaxID=29695 RepID=UPI002D79A40F|nr:stigma-specific STIG1-like protein 3 [Phragmites australis]
MRKATIFLMALALSLATAAALPVPAAMPPARRSRFLANVKFPPPTSYYDCIKKPPSICLEPGSPGATCCKGMCIDTEYNTHHCGNCNRSCKYGETCCAGKCVNLLTDKKNCGECGNQCSSHDCTFGFCNYAG